MNSSCPFSPIDPPWRPVTRDGIERLTIGDRSFLSIDSAVLRRLAREAFHDASFFLRSSQIDGWVGILRDPESSENDRFVAGSLIRNAIIAAEGVLPLCQDTGTAVIVAKRGECVLTGGGDEEALAAGIRDTYAGDCLRYSQMVATSLFDEANSQDNLPAQIDIGFAPGEEYYFLFVAKGGGSSNKTVLSQESKATLNPESFEAFLRERIKALGVAACPPYHLAVVVGGTSPEQNLKTLKLATAGALDHLPTVGSGDGSPFRDPVWERTACRIAAEQGFGAQFGGKWLALSARVIRLPRHAGSCPISVGVSCSAHRNLVGRISAEGAFLEQLEQAPSRYAKELARVPDFKSVRLDLSQSMEAMKKTLSALSIGTMVLLSGPLVVARDLAHARLYERLKSGQPLPDYFKNHPVYYAGPAKTPPGKPVGSMGPTTAQRMDGYLEPFMAKGASHITLAKGNRAPTVAAACKAHGGFYLGTIGGSAALLAQEHITECAVIDFPELGMEAVHRIVVRDLPAFIIMNHEGRSLY